MPSLRRLSALLAVLLVATVSLAGCFGGDEEPVSDDGTDDEDSGEDEGNIDFSGPRPTKPGGSVGPSNGSGNSTSPPGNGSNNTTGGGNNTTSAPPPVWPNINNAKVRPGVQVIVDGAQCTSNFLFRSRTNGTLYLGLAAHCVDGSSIGTKAEIRDVNGAKALTGRVAYSSWISLGWSPGASTVGDDVHPHDFALISIPADQPGIVHPAVLVYGGPVAVADYGDVGTGDRVLVYGNSGLYPRPGDLDPQEGVVLNKGSETVGSTAGYYVDAHMEFVPVQGDSGSGLMTKDGRALGALSTITAGTPYGVWWRYSSVPHALTYMEDHGWDLELQTWELIDDGLLP